MNVRRGMLRFWLALTVFWVGSVGFFAYEKFSNPFVFGDVWTTAPMGMFDDLIPGDHKERVIQANTFIKWDPMKREEDVIKVDFPDLSTLYITEKLDDEQVKRLAKNFWESRWHRYVQEIFPWAAGIFTPPLALLLFGWVIAWIARGFAA
jgi:hypothetical protein